MEQFFYNENDPRVDTIVNNLSKIIGEQAQSSHPKKSSEEANIEF